MTVEQAIRHARELIEQHEAERILPNEKDVRFALIDPMLRALQWRTHDPFRCQIEVRLRRGSGPISDYVLYTPTRLPRVVIEAKKLDTPDLTQAVRALRRQTSRLKSGFAVATNGRSWEIYNLKKKRQGRRFTSLLEAETDLAEDTIKHAASVLRKLRNPSP